jgi:hypothetical protein
LWMASTLAKPLTQTSLVKRRAKWIGSNRLSGEPSSWQSYSGQKTTPYSPWGRRNVWEHNSMVPKVELAQRSTYAFVLFPFPCEHYQKLRCARRQLKSCGGEVSILVPTERYYVRRSTRGGQLLVCTSSSSPSTTK